MNSYRHGPDIKALQLVGEPDHRPQKDDHAHFQQSGDGQQFFFNWLSRWRSPIVGYLVGLVLVIATLLIAHFYFVNAPLPYFTGAPFFLTTVIIAWLWGARPALFGILLEFLGLEMFIIPPPGIFSFAGWIDLVMFGPWILSQVAVALVTTQRESVRRRLQATEQELRARTEELAESNRQLEQANHLKDLFLSRASHELKTPITVIRGQVYLGLRLLSQLATETPAELAPLRMRLEKVDTQTNRLQALVNDLLDLSSLQAMKLPLRLIECDLQSLCKEVIDDQRALSGRYFDLEMPASPVIIQADCLRMSQVITNLVTNAVKYSPEGSVIGVQVDQEQSSVILQVHNDDPVIPQEEQSTIFEPFYRLANAQSSSKKGSGLGLSITKDIVERHKGRIWVESSEEKGTTFFVRLPL